MIKFVFYYILKSQKDNKMAIELVEMNYLQNNSYVQLCPFVVREYNYTGTGALTSDGVFLKVKIPKLIGFSSGSSLSQGSCFCVDSVNYEVLHMEGSDQYYYTLSIDSISSTSEIHIWLSNKGNLLSGLYPFVVFNANNINYKVFTIY